MWPYVKDFGIVAFHSGIGVCTRASDMELIGADGACLLNPVPH